ANITSGVYSVLAITAALNIFTCPLAILLNGLVIGAVKTKRYLRTKSNISLACLATTDFAVGLIVQPFVVTNFSLFFTGSSLQTMISTSVWVFSVVGQTCIAASTLHLLLMSGERYLAIKHPFAYENGLVTEARIITASGLAWMCAVIVYGIRVSILPEISFVFISAVISAVVYCHVVIYKEVRRNTQQIIVNQVSLAVKEKLLKNKRAFNTTVVIVLTLFLCYIPTCVWLILFISLDGENSSDVGKIAFFPITFLLFLNSSINPLIYTARIRHFRVAIFQMLTRKTLAQAEELEKKMFGANRVGEIQRDPENRLKRGHQQREANHKESEKDEEVILLNSLVIGAVKTKRRLRIKSNISLACLATTDFIVGLLVQPLATTNFSLFFTDSSFQTETRTIVCISSAVGETCIASSLLHLLLMSGERYLAIKHPFAYENGLVTEARIIMASGLAWMCAVIIFGIKTSFLREIGVVFISAVISTVVYCHLVIYKEVRRNTQQIIANQVSLAVKEKLLKNKRAFNTTVVIVLTLFLCYIPTCVLLIVFISLDGENFSDVGQIAYFPITFLAVLNSSINPLIYTARIRQFRVAIFQMLTRKTFAEAEEIENKMFGANRVGVA
ncbi:unnamed protein product, partial [Pocillopora meandrina]